MRNSSIFETRIWSILLYIGCCHWKVSWIHRRQQAVRPSGGREGLDDGHAVSHTGYKKAIKRDDVSFFWSNVGWSYRLNDPCRLSVCLELFLKISWLIISMSIRVVHITTFSKIRLVRWESLKIAPKSLLIFLVIFGSHLHRRRKPLYLATC